MVIFAVLMLIFMLFVNAVKDERNGVGTPQSKAVIRIVIFVIVIFAVFLFVDSAFTHKCAHPGCNKELKLTDGKYCSWHSLGEAYDKVYKEAQKNKSTKSYNNK